MTEHEAPSGAPLNLIQFRGAPHSDHPAWPGPLAASTALAAGIWLFRAAWRDSRVRWLLLSGAAAGACVEMVRRSRRRTADAQVDEMVEASFPASDPPSVPSVSQL